MTDEVGTEASGPYDEPELVRDHDWQRLDPRMLLVHPIRELVRFLPVIFVSLVAGSASGDGVPWHYLGVGVPIALGVLRYLTTRFRIAGGRIELQRGLLNRHVLSTPVDRVRTVDMTASLVQRVLGLTTVRVGTGTASTDDEDRLDLDGLPVERARELRVELLRVSTADDATPGGSVVPPERVVAVLDPTWVRFAPFTSSGLVIAAAALGALSQVLNLTGFWGRFRPEDYSDPGIPVGVLVPVGLVSLVVLVSLLSIGGYVVTNWGFRLTHTAAGPSSAWQVSRGLLTTRETTLDDDRVAGVCVSDPVGLRLLRGARLTAIVTGLDRKRSGSAALVPPAPYDVVHDVAATVTGAESAVTGPLVSHGPAAARRRWTRALVPAVAVAAAVVVAVVLGAPVWLLAGVLVLIPAAALAHDRVRSLGHALADGFVVSRSGSLARHRSALRTEHVIGWNLRSTWFQRRVGLTTLVATTAGGSQSLTLLDLPEGDAVAFAEAALPDLVSQFRD